MSDPSPEHIAVLNAALSILYPAACETRTAEGLRQAIPRSSFELPLLCLHLASKTEAELLAAVEAAKAEYETKVAARKISAQATRHYNLTGERAAKAAATAGLLELLKGARQ